MQEEIKTIRLALPFKMGSVNCYLVKTDDGFVLIDTGGSNNRRQLEQELERAGCQPGDLKLIILTHGDFDHTGNAAYLRQKYGTRVAMHPDDLGMAERGDMSWNREKGRLFLKRMAALLFGFGKSKRFKPDIYLDEGSDLSEFGIDAQALSIPGHSKGSIGILTASGDLFCGDLLENTRDPAINSIMDDNSAASASVEKLAGYEINTVYPGHGEAFQMEQFVNK